MRSELSLTHYRILIRIANNVAYEPSSSEQEYNKGKTTQVLVRNVVKLKTRCRRRIAYKNSELIFERNINAK